MPLLTTDLSILKADGCQLAEPELLMHGLMQATNNDPCTTGCAYNRGNECVAYQKHHSDFKKQPGWPIAVHATNPLVGGKWTGKSIKQIAEMEGISKNEAQRRRDRGDYVH